MSYGAVGRGRVRALAGDSPRTFPTRADEGAEPTSDASVSDSTAAPGWRDWTITGGITVIICRRLRDACACVTHSQLTMRGRS